MNTDTNETTAVEPAGAAPVSRLQVVWDVTLFQFKLVLDGLRDVLLSPVSIGSVIIGLIAGGDRPDRYYRKVIAFGRRTEIWINLFGRHRGPGTSDQLIDPFRSQVFDKAQDNAWLNKAGSRLNEGLDGVNKVLRSRQPPPGE